MSHNAFDQYGEPPPRGRRPDDSSGWRAFDSGGQVAAPASPSPPRGRPRNPYGGGEPGGQWNGRLMDAPPTVEAPSLWPPISEPSAPRVGAGLRPYHEPTTQEAPALRPGTRFREPTTAENMTIGQRPPSPYREYATGENPTLAPPRRTEPAEPYRVPASRRPDERGRAPHQSPPRFVPPQAADTATMERQQSFQPSPPPHQSPPRFQPSPPPHQSPPRFAPPQQTPQQSPPRFAPPQQTPQQFAPHAADTATIERQQPFHQSPPREQQHYGPAAFREPATAESAAVRPASASPFGFESAQRSILVEPDTGTMETRVNHIAADPPWQSRRAAEEDASFISPARVLATVGVIVVIIAIAGAVIWGLSLYGDKF